MADFTAVIRRAVDGLPEQSPELRARVYEKARSAVVRQMENMSPAPPEALIKRQIDKIDAAIAEVESEFAEALPPVEDELSVEPEVEAPDNAPAELSGEADGDEPVRWQSDAPRDDAEQHEPEERQPSPEDAVHSASEHKESFDQMPADGDNNREAEDEPYSEEPLHENEKLHGATFEAVSAPSHVSYEDDDPEDDAANYSYDEPEDEDDSDVGTVIVEPDDEDQELVREEELDEPVSEWQLEATAVPPTSFEPAPPPPRRSVPEKDWAHVDSLLGLEPEDPGDGFGDYDEMAGGEEHQHSADHDTGGKRRVLLIAGAAVIALVLAIGGYFAWDNRNSIIAAISPADRDQTVVESTASQPDATPAEPAGTETAETEKPFTQRLLPDGTEVDEGLPAAGASSGPARSVANQTSASAPAETVAAAPTSDPSPPVGAAQKMYLYEEQLGQSVPSAFEGSVEWELKQENTGTAVSEPVVEGVLNVPDAGLSGVLTFRRNDDPSLPASHLIDISFTLNDDFKGGAIDNVQRMSMKGTEAARGDPLIAVSAKITDDLYMLALNDFDQARAQNLALLGDRNWIDIPVTYRNGRRALLTLEKGTTGMAIFNRAIQEWRALGDINDGN
nr:hypothetical protein [Marinicella sp. W31]MDC2879791.1 hypothetical protein [Marinicella sp. W31]